MKTNSFLGIAGAISLFSLAIMGCNKNLDEVMQSDTQDQVALKGSRTYCESKGLSVFNPAGKQWGASLRAVENAETIYSTDYVSAGVGGLRYEAGGTIALSGVTGTVTKAYLYWHGVTSTSAEVGGTLTFAGNSVTGTNIGISSSNCWPEANSQAYRADVTTIVQGMGDGSYSIGGFSGISLNGASLLVFFDDGDNTNNRDIVLFEGNDSNNAFAGIDGVPQAPADATGWNVALNGINYTTGSASVELHVGDGQIFADASVVINGTEVAAAGAVFDGNTVPAANNGPNNNGSLWDIRSWDVTSLLTAGLNDLTLTSGQVADCLSLIVAAINLPAGAAPVDRYFFDIKPGSCPSSVNLGDKGLMPAAILGTAGFDVTTIDLSTLRINGLAPVKTSYEDVTAPYMGELTDCMSCNTAEPDGIMDLALKFNTKDFAVTLPLVQRNDCVEITITGKLKAEFGGTDISATDIIRIIK